jgi:hypothetical protein
MLDDLCYSNFEKIFLIKCVDITNLSEFLSKYVKIKAYRVGKVPRKIEKFYILKSNFSDKVKNLIESNIPFRISCVRYRKNCIGLNTSKKRWFIKKLQTGNKSEWINVC